jgi:predicted permease
MERLLRRLRYLLRRGRHDADLRIEVETHRSLRQAQLERAGLAPPDAVLASRRALGNQHLAREESRGVWTVGWLERAWQDLVSGARILRTAPGLTLTAVALLALVIGGNATIYSVVHGILRKGAPGVDARDMYTLSWTNERGEVWAERSYDHYEKIAAEARTLSPLLACTFQRVALGIEDGVSAVRAGLVSPNYFETLRLQLAKGRVPSQEESRPDAPGLVAVITDRIWREQFGRADDVIGRSLTVNGRHATVIGVAPPWFHGAWLGEMFDVWLPFSSYPQVVRSTRGVSDGRHDAPVLIAGRLQPGVSRAEAQAEVATIDGRIQMATRKSIERLTLVPYSATAGGNSLVATQGGRFLAVFSVVTVLTLLIVCANVANLMLGRAVNRQREIAVRRSLGCSHARIVRMLLAEGIVVAVLAWAAALVFAWVVAGVLASVIPLPQGASAGFAQWYFQPDSNVALYAIGLAAIATVTCVLGPVLFAWRQPLTPWLKAGEHSVIRGRSRLSRSLVVLQLSLSVLLVAVAGLAWRSLSIVDGLDLGFRPDNMLIATVSTAATEEREAKARILDAVRDRLARLPGAAIVTYVDNAPRETAWERHAVRADAADEPVRAELNHVGTDFAAVHGLTLVTGQDLSRVPRAGGRTALINKHLADTLWPGTSPLGRHMRVGDDGMRQAQVVGIVPDAFFSGFRQDSRPNFVFFSAADDLPSGSEASFYVRYDGRLDRMIAGVRETLGPSGLAIPIVSLRTMESRLNEITALPRMLAQLLAAFATGALIIATLGQYSVVLFDMRRRVREFGVRLALGASPQRIQSSVIREGAKLSIIGLVIGGALSLGVGQLIRGVLYGVTPTDATTYVSVAALLAATTLVACAIPARLASRVDPLRVLREE